MPIHLPPVPRREFLKTFLLAGVGVTVSPHLIAKARPVDENAWALLADTHVSADVKTIARGVNMADHLRSAAAELVALPKRPSGVFILGDCAFSSGELADYTTLTGLIDSLRRGGFDLHLGLGNHDQRDNFWAALVTQAKITRPVVDKHVALIRDRHVNWFLLDSLEKTLVTPGSLGEAQLGWLTRSLDANRKKPAVILTHHHPAREENAGALKDTRQLLEIIRPRRQVKAWIFGHTHKWNVTTDESGIHLVNLPPVAYVFQDDLPSGWALTTLRKDGFKLELRCIDRTHRDQGQILDLKWRAA